MLARFTSSNACSSRVHCRACRTDAAWRQSAGAPVVCPFGVSELGLGDRIAAVATPIARAFGMNCVDRTTRQLKPESACARAKKRLNQGEPIIPTLIKRMKGLAVWSD